VAPSRLSIAVSFSVPATASLASAGASVYSEPSGLGAVTTSRTTGPRGVNSTWRVYVTPGMSSACVSVVWRDARPGRPAAVAVETTSAASATPMSNPRSTTRRQGNRDGGGRETARERAFTPPSAAVNGTATVPLACSPPRDEGASPAPDRDWSCVRHHRSVRVGGRPPRTRDTAATPTAPERRPHPRRRRAPRRHERDAQRAEAARRPRGHVHRLPRDDVRVRPVAGEHPQRPVLPPHRRARQLRP